MAKRKGTGKPVLSKRISKHRIKLLIVAAVLISTIFGVYLYAFQQQQSQLPTEPGYTYEQFASVDIGALPEQQEVHTWNYTYTGCTFPFCGKIFPITFVWYDGNFTFRDTIVYYRLEKAIYVNGTSQISNFDLFFYAPSRCDFAKPRSDINCRELLLAVFTTGQSVFITGQSPSPTFYAFIAAGYPSWWANKQELPLILSSHLTLSLATFQGYSWCPVQGVGRVTGLLCRFNPDYNYQEVASVNASSLTSTGTFKWQNVTLNYSLSGNGGNVLLNVREESGPSCDVTKSRSQNNCQQIVLLGFDIPNYPGHEGAPFDAVYVLPYNQTQNFSVYSTSSNIQQHLYVIIGTYEGDYKGILMSSYNSDMYSWL